MSRVSKRHLRRYTDIPALVYLLKEKRITLLDPQSWDDKNDSRYLKFYQEKSKLRTVLALCFAQASETYHHWRVFAHGPGGVCICFKRYELLRAIRKQSDLRMGEVRYLTLDEVRETTPATQELPFLKRYPFEDESEYRVIYESKTANYSTLDIDIPLSCIDKVTLSPWLPRALGERVKILLRTIDGCHDLKIHRSTLISNEEWKSLGESAPTLDAG